MSALDGLVERLNDLDASLPASDRADEDDCFTAFVSLWQHVTGCGYITPDMVMHSVEQADEAVAHSRVIDRLRRDVPHIVSGPIDHASQRWIRTAASAPSSGPASSRFAADLMVTKPWLGTKPFSGGLYTSTATAHTRGMWHTYLEVNRGSTLFPLPWEIWSLVPGEAARVLSIPNGRQWVEFVLAYPLVSDQLIYPDWRRAAADYDGVHITVGAVAAVQGAAIAAGDDMYIAPSYWDVEQTFWLNWSFDSAELLATEQ